MTFTLNDIPDLSGKIAIVTGSTAGIGKVSALELARKNCHVIIACRNQTKGNAVVKEIQEQTGNQNVECIILDLTSLASVKQFTTTILTQFDQLHILLNNAGVLDVPYRLTEDGIESMFATNHVGHFYLTLELLPLLIKSGPSRIVNVASMMHGMTTITGAEFDKMSEEQYFNRKTHYGKTKVANILFTYELNRRLKAKGINNVYVNCNHPGAIKTDPYYESGFLTKGSLLDSFTSLFFVSPEEGALTQLYLATSPEIEQNDIKGQYYVPTAKLSSSNGFSKSEENATKLWNVTEKLLEEKAPGGSFHAPVEAKL
ncbi:hypothetical protein BDA99DRAFT_201092 [Phascolomyces articulosus]|uniref:Uncharacterized protein n=1 Tax=Phascolomyces articulosus TaxID=60185 RepID=A0AAD5PA50_9FUNG|nr:hypothetical protein BDA99DRAFT_201092 [Phascolomyces articulosus]